METVTKDKMPVENPESKNEPSADPAQGRTFTEEEVNKIVEDRLARYKRRLANKNENEQNDAASREADLSARETRLACREYVLDNGLSTDLLDIIGTDDVETFKAKAEKLSEIAKVNHAYPQVMDDGEVTNTSAANDLEKAFSRSGSAHVPKDKTKLRW